MAKRKRAKPKKRAEPTTIAGIAAAIGVAERTFASWRRRGCPQGPIAEVEKWRAANMVARAAEVDASPLAKLKVRKLREDIRGKRIKNHKDEERMIFRDDAERVFAELCLAIKNELEKLPDAIEMDIPREHRAALKTAIANRINQALQRMSQWTI